MVIRFIDFPCSGSEPGCVDPFTIQVWQTSFDCSVFPGCENACCEGATCIEIGDEPCPRGELCVAGSVDYPYQAECLPAEDVCGGPRGRACEMGELCEYAQGECPACLEDPGGCGMDSPVGRCVPQPAPEADCGEPMPGQEQCGCDGVTYPSECERRKAGAALADLGSC